MNRFKKLIICAFSIVVALSLCSCGQKDASSDNDKSAETTTTTSQTTTLTTTTPATTTEDTDNIIIEENNSLTFESYDEMKEYLAKNFDGYYYYLPEVDGDKYSYQGCFMFDSNTGSYCVSFRHNEDNDRSVTVYSQPQKEKMTFDDLLAEENKTLFPGKDDEFDMENKIFYWTGPWGDTDPFSITYITQDGIKIMFDAQNNRSKEEIKYKFDEFMSAVNPK